MNSRLASKILPIGENFPLLSLLAWVILKDMGLKRFVVLFGLLAPIVTLAQTAATGGGGDAPRHGVGLGFGQVFLLGDMNTTFQNNIGFNLNYSYESGATYGLLVNLHVNSHGSLLSPTDSLGVKALVPNLKVNVIKKEHLVLSGIAGLGAYKIDEVIGTSTGSFLLFAIQLGAVLNVEVSPHFRFGPSLTFIKLSGGTDTSSTTSAPLTISGNMVELFFNVMYLF